MFRYTIIGEALDAAIKEVQEKYGSSCVSNDAVERIMTKFDDVAAKVFCSEDGSNERGKQSQGATITATEHEFERRGESFHDVRMPNDHVVAFPWIGIEIVEFPGAEKLVANELPRRVDDGGLPMPVQPQRRHPVVLALVGHE